MNGKTDRFGGRSETIRWRPAQAVTILYLVVGVWYLWWRTTNTVNTDALWLSLPFLFADIAGFGFFVLFAANLWQRIRRWAPPAPDGLAVDVYITTYNEPVDILRPTIMAAVAMDYPHITWVLDDGRREEVRDLCAELGARYLSRPDNRGAKAGNINAALPRTNGDLIAIFDADHVPYRSFLTELLGYFRDPEVALAQAPQAYYNLDSFQHARPPVIGRDELWHEQTVFYDRIMPGKDRWNAAFWCGSSAILRREALEAIGGVDTRTVTEDMHTAMSLHAAGWRSVYHDRPLAVGIAPDEVESFLAQRLRWARGATQILSIDNPLLRRGLTWRQRIAYFTSVVYVAEYLPKTVYLLTPVVALTLGVLPMEHMGWNLLWRFLPYYALGIVASLMLTQGANPWLPSERYHLLKLGIMLRALGTLVWPRAIRFNVTRKDGNADDQTVRHLRPIKWQIVVGIASLFAAGWAVLAFYSGVEWELTGVSLVITVGWALLNAAMVASMARWILRRPHRRTLYRFPVELPLVIHSGPDAGLARTIDVSAEGVAFTSALRLEPGQVIEARIDGPGLAVPPVSLEIRSARHERERNRYGARFSEISPEARHLLILFLYQQVAPGTLLAGRGAGRPALLSPDVASPPPRRKAG